MQPIKQPKRVKRHGTSVSTVNLGLNYGFTPTSSSANSSNSSAQKTVASDELGLSIGNPPRALSNRSFSSGMPRSKVISPQKHDRPASGNSFFVANQEELPSTGTSAGKLSWQSLANSYSLRRGIAHSSKLLHGTAQNLYQIQQSSNSGTINEASQQDSIGTGKETTVAINQSSSQFYLPGDRVIFTEIPAAPGIPVVYRIEDERLANPDKLNLDRRGLTVCPILEGEGSLRLLNFQHNLIRKIENLSSLRKLIFLDLYDNQVEEISGLSQLRSLRVLMLGKNRITKIENLQELSKLDVLDLHGNKIAKIENISHLAELRVLNLASNELVTINNLAGLNSLTELNLRRNKITNVNEVDLLPNIQRLFMSYNNIKIFQDINSVGRSESLSELSLDGNPFASELNYKQTILLNVTSLRQLDMKKITDEERRIQSVMARKEDEKRREFEKLSTLKERRQLAINNAKRQYESQYCKDTKKESSSDASNSSQNLIGSKSVCHLAELDDNCLNFYGPGALEALDRNWGDKAASSLAYVAFQYINFDQIVPYITKVKSKFPNVISVTFKETNISHFGQINALALLDRLEELYIEEGNPIVEFSLWKPYIFFRLSHLSLNKLNGVEVTTTDYVHAEKVFGSLGHVTTSQLSQAKLITMLKKQKKAGNISDLTLKNESSNENSKKERNSNGESVNKAGLIYHALETSKHEKEEIKLRQSFATNYIHEIQQNVFLMERKREMFEKIWPQFFKDLIQGTASQMTDIDKYMELSLQKIKSS
eukprot:gene9894-10907_t